MREGRAPEWFVLFPAPPVNDYRCASQRYSRSTPAYSILQPPPPVLHCYPSEMLGNDNQISTTSDPIVAVRACHTHVGVLGATMSNPTTGILGPKGKSTGGGVDAGVG